MGQSYKDTAQSIFLFVFLVFMVNVFLNRTVSNFFYDYNEYNESFYNFEIKNNKILFYLLLYGKYRGYSRTHDAK